MVVTSDEWWNEIDEDVRTQFAQILKDVTQERNTESFNVNEENKQALIDAGVEIRTLTPEQRQLWVDALKPVWEKFEPDIGQDLIDAAIASNEE